ESEPKNQYPTGCVNPDQMIRLWTTLSVKLPVEESLSVERELVRQLELATLQLFDVHVLEGEHAHRLHEAVGAVDVPHPHVVHGELEVEIVLGIATDNVDLVGEVEATLGLDHVLKLPHDVAVLAEQRELE